VTDKSQQTADILQTVKLQGYHNITVYIMLFLIITRLRQLLILT